MTYIRSIAAAIAFLATTALAQAQSGCPSIAHGAVLTAAQWQACFSAKQDTIPYVTVNKAGDTMLGRLTTAPSTTLASGFNVAPGATPTSPNNGDVWTTSSGLFVRINGSTVGPLNSGISTALSSARIYVGNASNVATAVLMSGDATLANTGAITVAKTGGVNFGAFATGTNAANLTGVVPAASGGAGTVNGALKGNGSGLVTQAACADLSNATASCSTDATNASNISSGTLPTGRISGSYTGITGTGTLTSGATGAGFTLAFGSSTKTGTIPAVNGGFGSDVSASSGVPLFATGTPSFVGTTGSGGNFVRATSPTISALTLTGVTTFPSSTTIDGSGNINAGGQIRKGISSYVGTDLGLYSAGSSDFMRFQTNAGPFKWYADNTGVTEAMSLEASGLLTPAGGVLSVAAPITTWNAVPFKGYSNGGITQTVNIDPAAAGASYILGTGGFYSGGSLRAIGSTAFPSGSGVELAYTGGVGYLLSYNRTGSAFLPLEIDASSLNLSGNGGTLQSGAAGISGVPGCIIGDGATPANLSAVPCSGGTGMPVGGAVGQLPYNVSSGTANWFTPSAFNVAASSDVNCITGALANPLSTIASGKRNILIPPGCLITIAASDTLPTTMTVQVACGATVHVNTGQTLTINGLFVDVGPCGTLFTTAGTGKVVGIASVRCEWWGCSPAASAATNDAANLAAIASVEGSGSSLASERKITFSCGSFSIASMMTYDLSVIGNWTVQGCGGNSHGTSFVTAASFSGNAAFWFTGAGTIPDLNVSGFFLINQIAGSGPTYGMLVGPTNTTCCMNGYHNNLFTDINVSGFSTNIRQQNSRLFVYDRVATNASDNSGSQAINSVGWECYASANSYCGDTELTNSQVTGQTTSQATYTGAISGTTLTVSGVSGTIAIGQGVAGQGGGVLPGTTITGGSGTTWTINQSQTVSSRAMHASFTGSNVLLNDGGNALAIVTGIGFHHFTTYGGFYHLNLTQSGAGGRIGDIFAIDKVQFEGIDGNGIMVNASANGGSIDDMHFSGNYGAGNGFGFHFKGTVAGGASIKSWKISDAFLSNAAWQFVDFRGTGGHCLDMNVTNNTLRGAGADGAANPLIYYENCENSNILGNTVVAPSVSRPHLFSLNIGGGYITCMNNNSGGNISGSICDNAAGIGTFKIAAPTDSNQ